MTCGRDRSHGLLREWADRPGVRALATEFALTVSGGAEFPPHFGSITQVLESRLLSDAIPVKGRVGPPLDIP